jgi:D-alanine--D-alanine ligase
MIKQSLIIVCGGPSGERGISLNSARCVYDNLDKTLYDVSLIYFNTKLDAFAISPAQIYSNTPMDFDYLLKSSKQKLTKAQLKKQLKKADVVFPVIHGTFGEDGQLQTLLESCGVRYTGSGPDACRITNDKHLCTHTLEIHGFYASANISVKKKGVIPRLPKGKFVVKPQNGGSSLGVYIVESQAELEEKLKKVFELDDNALLEPFCEGQEFTIIVLQNGRGEPVALLPTEVEFCGDTLFDYRKKYLATGETRYHTPARASAGFTDKVVEQIRHDAQRAFSVLKMKDFARMDGWLLPDGKIWFSDINAISGMEQNSFLFQQPGFLGMSHRQVLQYILEKKITRTSEKDRDVREEIPVFFGGASAERQVSIMSGTNVWIKLKSSKKYRPIPYFLTRREKIFQIPHFLCLQHTVEEIEEKIPVLQDEKMMERWKPIRQNIFHRLGISEKDLDEPLHIPTETTLEKLAKKHRFFFLGLHGSPGEDGTWQKKLDRLGVSYNGPGEAASRLCMDKFETGAAIEKAKIPGVRVARKMSVGVKERPSDVWKRLQDQGFSTHDLLLKPRSDGCSTGVLRINSLAHLEKYMAFVQGDFSVIPAGAIHKSHGIIDIPYVKMHEILIEEFVETDKVLIHDLTLDWRKKTDWIEVTCGVFGRRGNLHAFYPSQTVANLDVLSLEEKFMGGTGINFTPPPKQHVSPKIVALVKKRVEKIAEVLGIENYSRLDLFIHCKTGEVIVIEANTLPALTPSTVLFHQALSEKKPIFPLELLEKFIEMKITPAPLR